MELSRDQSCVDRINWRCDLPEGVSGERLFDVLSHMQGYSIEGGGPLLYVLRTPGLHQVLIVPRTGRVQIRVSYEVPKIDRRRAAEEVFACLVRALRTA